MATSRGHGEWGFRWNGLIRTYSVWYDILYKGVPMIRSSDITSLSEYRKHLREHHDRIRKSKRPLYVTSNGATDAVVLSPEAFDEMVERVEIAESLTLIDRSMEDIEAGRVRPMREAIRDIADELGLKLDT